MRDLSVNPVTDQDAAVVHQLSHEIRGAPSLEALHLQHLGLLVVGVQHLVLTCSCLCSMLVWDVSRSPAVDICIHVMSASAPRRSGRSVTCLAFALGFFCGFDICAIWGHAEEPSIPSLCLGCMNWDASACNPINAACTLSSQDDLFAFIIKMPTMHRPMLTVGFSSCLSNPMTVHQKRSVDCSVFASDSSCRVALELLVLNCRAVPCCAECPVMM